MNRWLYRAIVVILTVAGGRLQPTHSVLAAGILTVALMLAENTKELTR